MRTNCWDAKRCGRQPGGNKAKELGICPAAIESRVDGINGGVNGGRACWAINKTLCDNKVQGSFSTKLKRCLQCEFYSTVWKEEGDNYLGTRKIFCLLGD